MSAVLFLTVFVRELVHFRSAMGHLKHLQRSVNRGFAMRPWVPSDLHYSVIDSAFCPPVDNIGNLEMEASSDVRMDSVLPTVPPPPTGFCGVFSWELVCEDELMFSADPLQPSCAGGEILCFEDSVVLDKDVSLPIIISLAELIPSITKSAPTDAIEFGFELRRRVRDWAPKPAGSFGIPLRRLVRGPCLDDRGAVDMLDAVGSATCVAFYIGEEDSLDVEEEAVEDDFCPVALVVADVAGAEDANVSGDDELNGAVVGGADVTGTGVAIVSSVFTTEEARSADSSLPDAVECFLSAEHSSDTGAANILKKTSDLTLGPEAVPVKSDSLHDAFGKNNSSECNFNRQLQHLCPDFLHVSKEFSNLHDQTDPKNTIVQNELHALNVQKQMDRLDSLLLKLAWAEAGNFLKNDFATFYALCEGLPSQPWRRCLVQMSLAIARLDPPPRSAFYRCSFKLLQNLFDSSVVELCSKFKARLSVLDDSEKQKCKSNFPYLVDLLGSAFCSAKDIPCTDVTGHSGTYA